MRIFNQKGSINALLIPLIVAVVAFFGTLGFALWSYSQRTDYKENSDKKVATAVEVAKQETATEKDNEFIEREKQPLQEYKGPAAFGGISLKYPKTWSAHVDEEGTSAPINGFFHPNFVPGVKSDTAFALRLEVSKNSFSQEIKQFDSYVRSGEAKAKPYKPVNVDNIVGTQIDGRIDSQKQGRMILMPLRDKTIKLWVESDQFINDFENNILKNFNFTP